MSGSQDASKDESEFGASEYLGYRVLAERYEQDNKETGRTKFFKLSCLTDRYLKEEYDRDIGFPWHWYMYGKVLEEHSVNRGFFFAPSANHQEGQAYYPAREVNETDFDVPDDVKDDIFSAARKVVKKYGKKDRSELEKLQYTHYAPNEFIRTYSELRWHLVALSLEQSDHRQRALPEFDDRQTGSYIEDSLDELLVQFPDQQYSEIYEQYLSWDDTMRLLVKNDAPPREMHDFLELFITKLSEVCLRFVHQENIPENRIEKWKDEIPDHLEELDDSISEVRTALLEDYSDTARLNTVANAYNETILDRLKET